MPHTPSACTKIDAIRYCFSWFAKPKCVVSAIDLASNTNKMPFSSCLLFFFSMDDLLAYSKYELVLCISKLNNTALQVVLQRVHLILISIVSF